MRKPSLYFTVLVASGSVVLAGCGAIDEPGPAEHAVSYGLHLLGTHTFPASGADGSSPPGSAVQLEGFVDPDEATEHGLREALQGDLFLDEDDARTLARIAAAPAIRGGDAPSPALQSGGTPGPAGVGVTGGPASAATIGGGGIAAVPGQLNRTGEGQGGRLVEAYCDFFSGLCEYFQRCDTGSEIGQFRGGCRAFAAECPSALGAGLRRKGEFQVLPGAVPALECGGETFRNLACTAEVISSLRGCGFDEIGQ